MSVDLMALRSYVMAKDDQIYDGLAEGTVSLSVTHSNLRQKWPELRFDKHTTIADIKAKLNKHCGTPTDMMELQLKSDGAVVCTLADNTRMLGFYSPANGMELHIVDHDPTSLSRGGALEDVSLVDKYMLTDEQYDKMENTVRAYKRNKLKEDPSYKFKKLPGFGGLKTKVDVESEACIAHANVGDRCIVKPGARRGEVAFVGKIPKLKKGYWIGVRFDEPVGKGDGTIGGKRYFECDAKFGAFARPHNVETGDFPPEDLFDELDSSDDDIDADAVATPDESKDESKGESKGSEGCGAGAGAGVGADCGCGTAGAGAAAATPAATASEAAAATGSSAGAAGAAEGEGGEDGDGDSDDEL